MIIMKRKKKILFAIYILAHIYNKKDFHIAVYGGHSYSFYCRGEEHYTIEILAKYDNALISEMRYHQEAVGESIYNYIQMLLYQDIVGDYKKNYLSVPLSYVMKHIKKII